MNRELIYRLAEMNYRSEINNLAIERKRGPPYTSGMDKKKIGMQIKFLQGGMKNQEMADLLGGKLDRYQKLVTGQIVPPPEFVETLAERFNVSMDFIYRGIETGQEGTGVSADEQDLLQAYRESTPIGQRDILRAALRAQNEARHS